MLTFKEFMEQKGLVQLTEGVQPAVTAFVIALLANNLGYGRADAVSREVNKVLNGESFLRTLSDTLPDPTHVESEDSFVEEAERVLRHLLCERFGVRED